MKSYITAPWSRAMAVGLASVSYLSAMVCGQSDPLRVGVWNIEKLSTTAARGFPELQGARSLPPRTDADLRAMASYIRNEVGADALMITEIEADSPDSTDSRPQSAQLNRLCEILGPNWRYFLSRTGGKMRLGLLFDEERVKLKKLVNLHAPEFPVAGTDVFDRDPFIVWISALRNGAEGNDVLLACVHLKSQQGPFKDNRMAAIAKLVGDMEDKKVRQQIGLPDKNEEPETVILGDCNDSSFKNPGFKYMFDYLKGVGFAHMVPGDGSYPPTRVNGSQIDHLFANRALVSNLLVPGSLTVHGTSNADLPRYRRQYSDHFPVSIDLAAEESDGPDAAPEFRVEAVAPSETMDDEDEQASIAPRVEIIEGDFERILAPVRRADLQAPAPVVPPVVDQPQGGGVRPVPGFAPEGLNLASSAHGRFEGEVIVQWLDEGAEPFRQMRLIRDFTFVDSRGVRWRAPAGVVVDGASIPPVFWNKFIGPPYVGAYRKASVVHDVACDSRERPHREVHRMFHEACLAGGESRARANVMYWAVRTFGPKWQSGASFAAAATEVGIGELTDAYEVEALLEAQPDMSFERLEGLMDQALKEAP